MKRLKIGDRVEYIGTTDWFSPLEPKTGTVTDIYEGFDDLTLRTKPYPDNWAACVQLDAVPDNWPYPNDRFAPDVSDLRLVS